MTGLLRNLKQDPIENLISAFDVMYPKRNEIHQALKQFITQNEDPMTSDCVRNDIAESWKRSRNYGVSLNLDPLQRKVEPSTLKCIAKDNQLLIEVVKTILLEDLAFLKHHSDFCALLYDRNMINLLGFGGNGNSNLNERIGMDFSEKSIGTNSGNLCAFLDKPFLITPSENFSQTIIIQNVSAAISVPIHAPEGDIIGVLTFAYPSRNDLYLTNRGMLSGMISFQIALVKKIENKLKIINQDHARFNTVSLLTNDSLIAVNKLGKIQQMNNMAEKLLGDAGAHFKGKNITKVIGNHTELIKALKTNKPTKDFSAHFLINGEKMDCVIRLIPLILRDGMIIRITRSKPSPTNSSRPKSGYLNALYTFSDILGNSPELARAKQLAEKFAATPRNILLLGESGTGKELFAHAIHNASCSQGPFITINCSCLPRGLVESEFFGYEAGSFTGADRKGRAGKLEMADGGTLFLDEIGDMPLGFQPILLRVLEEKRVMRIGGNHYIPINFRVVAATNKDLKELITQNLFREDLYYRLSSFKVLIPSLKQRRNDIPLLTRHFIRKQCQEYNLPIPTIESAVDQALMSYGWPGNIRELQNAICTALCLAEDGVLKVKDLPLEFSSHCSDLNDDNQLKTLEELEQQAIHHAMFSTGYNVEKAALVLGISRSSLYQKLSELQNAINTASCLAEDGVIKVTNPPSKNFNNCVNLNSPLPVKTLEELEQQSIRDAMFSTEYNVKEAAKALGISCSSLYQKLKEYHIRTKKG